MNNTISQQQLAIRLAKISLVLWIISLGLVGFTFYNGNFRGMKILLLGLLFGWSRFGFLTVYSNVFYVFVTIKLLKKQKPKKSVIFMTILAFLLVPTIITNNVNMNFDTSIPDLPISWGWGAILLLFTQSLIVISAFLAHEKISVKWSYRLIGILILPMIVIGVFGNHQKNQANEWEKKHYFPTYDVAFTKKELSGLPSQFLTEKLSDNAIIEIKFVGNIPPLITENESSYPRTYWHNGMFWEQYFTNILGRLSMVVEKNNIPNYRLEISNPKFDYYLYTLYNEDNKVIYQQPVVRDKIFGDSFFPSLYSTVDNIGYVTREKQKESLLWKSEKGQDNCVVKKIETNNLNTIWQVGKHRLRIFDYNIYSGKADGNFSPSQALCSDNYLLAFDYDKEKKSVYDAWLFERKTGFPVASFRASHYSENTLPVTENDIKQFELVVLKRKRTEKDKSHLILHTNNGDIILRLSRRQREIYR